MGNASADHQPTYDYDDHRVRTMPAQIPEIRFKLPRVRLDSPTAQEVQQGHGVIAGRLGRGDRDHAGHRDQDSAAGRNAHAPAAGNGCPEIAPQRKAFAGFPCERNAAHGKCRENVTRGPHVRDVRVASFARH